MSMFLGPIHYWLYGKIGNQERLTAIVAEAARKNGWATDTERYTKELPPLDTVIDTGNIHAWLQAQITDAEQRFADLITGLAEHMDEITGCAFEFGKQNRIHGEADAEEIYRYFEDFFVNGMPCDHVNAVTGQSEESLTWEMTQDIHAPYWTTGEVNHYYEIRKAVMDGMLSDTEYRLIMKDIGHYSIQRGARR